MSKKQGGIGGGFELLMQRKSSYLKYSPEDFEKKLQEFQNSNAFSKRNYEVQFDKPKS